MPFYAKIKVLYTCLFAALLYSVEAWGDTLKIERDAFKRCLEVESATTNDLIYIELHRPDIISTIKNR